MSRPRPVMLMILDGWGLSASRRGNAIAEAGMPVLERLAAEYPFTQLLTSGEAVGLPEGVMGNSEVGHLNIGAGRVVYQDLVRIDRAIREGTLFDNPALGDLMERVRARGSALHLLGLLSDGGVHSHIRHLEALLEMARRRGLQTVWVHPILDGRDTAPDSGRAFVAALQALIAEKGGAAIASLCGRYFAMDRDRRWDRTERAYRLYTRGEGRPERDPSAALEAAYGRGETDEFVQPVAICGPQGTPLAPMDAGDGVIFFNYRADRARQITRALTAPDFSDFARGGAPELCGFAGMTQYDETFGLPAAFAPVHLEEILGEVVSRAGLRQLRIAETEKYAHVTYFFNGGREKPFPLEERCLIPSPREVATYDLKPEMSAPAVTREVVARLRSGAYDLVVLNFANLDMVGHTGVMAAAIQACRTVDRSVGEIVAVLREIGGAALLTADHGNAEKMIDEGGHVYTAHTLNPVPCLLVDDLRRGARLRSGGKLCDIAPTLLELLELPQPEAMTGRSLLKS